MTDTQRDHIFEIEIDQGGVVRYSADIEAERNKAVEDLLTGNHFRLVDKTEPSGPYRVALFRREERLVFDINGDGGDAAETRVSLHLAPIRRTIRDYFTVCESYFEAGGFARPGRLEVIDAGRKALHDEGAQILRDRLSARIDIDHDTARRLFTLICVLHVKV